VEWAVGIVTGLLWILDIYTYFFIVLPPPLMVLDLNKIIDGEKKMKKL